MNIFDSDADVLVNPVNCRGVMGAGLALKFKQRFSKNFFEYRGACARGEVQVGKIYWTLATTDGTWIANFPTKIHWSGKSKIDYIRDGLESLRIGMCKRQLWSVAIPKIGCGLGGLDWGVVKPMIDRTFLFAPEISVEYT